MSERRSVLGRRGQLLVALPAMVRRHLNLSASAVVYWHVSRNGEVTLSLAERRPGGRPSADADCSKCDERQRELVRLRGLLHTRDAADGARYFGQGYQAAIRHHGNLDAKLDTALDHLRELLGRDPRRRSRRKPQAAPRARDVVEVVPAPVLAEPATRRGDPPVPARRSSPTLLDGIARDVLAGIAERRIEALEEQNTSRSDL